MIVVIVVRCEECCMSIELEARSELEEMQSLEFREERSTGTEEKEYNDISVVTR